MVARRRHSRPKPHLGGAHRRSPLRLEQNPIGEMLRAFEGGGLSQNDVAEMLGVTATEMSVRLRGVSEGWSLFERCLDVIGMRLHLVETPSVVEAPGEEVVDGR